VTTQKDGTELVLHFSSVGSASDWFIHALRVDGKEGIEAQIPEIGRTVPGRTGHLVLVVNLAEYGLPPKAVGSVWTVVYFTGSSLPGIGVGGRVINERFPIEAWVDESDCPFPGGNEGNAAAIKALSIGSEYLTAGDWDSRCASSGNFSATMNRYAESPSAADAGWFHLIVQPQDLEGLLPRTRTLLVDALFLGDEVDGGLDAKHLRPLLQQSISTMSSHPALPTYQGSKTNAFVGSFAGITDIQGGDAYVAACAPTQVPVTANLPLQLPAYWLRNVALNHEPLPFWGYSQLFSRAWKYQAQTAELIAQIGQVVLSGSKGLMLFQAVQDLLSQVDTLPDVAGVLASIRTLSEFLRVGDVDGLTTSIPDQLKSKVMLQTILAPRHLIVVLINTNAKGYSNLLCHTGISKHWGFDALQIPLITLNTSSARLVTGIGNWSEARGVDGLVPLSQADKDVVVTGGEGPRAMITIANVKLEKTIPVRFFVADVKQNPRSEARFAFV
jgi:hypothetical protein